jgi:hypothetical protein
LTSIHHAARRRGGVQRARASGNAFQRRLF